MRAHPAPVRLRRFLYLNRRALAALCTFVAVLALVSVLAPPRPPGVAVVAAARDLPAGTILADGDLVAVELPPDAAPDGAVASASEVVGRTLGAPLTRRSPVTSASVSTGERLARAGFLVVPLALPHEELAPLVRPGTTLTLFDAGGEMVADDVRVLSTPDAAGGLGLGGARRAVLVEVEPVVATRIATASQAGSLTVAVR